MSSTNSSKKQTVRDIVWLFRAIAISLILCVSCSLMLKTVIGYSSFQKDVQFLAQKQDYIPNKLWMTAFYIHVFSAVFSLFAGFTQFSGQLLRDHRTLHRFFGRAYSCNVLFINVPSGLILAIYANGGVWGKSAFILLDSLWFLFTYKAIRTAQKRNFKAHKEFMIRSYALAFSAITLRTWKIILLQWELTDPILLYRAEAWMGFLPNLVLVEIWLLFCGSNAGTEPLPQQVKQRESPQN